MSEKITSVDGKGQSLLQMLPNFLLYIILELMCSQTTHVY